MARYPELPQFVIEARLGPLMMLMILPITSRSGPKSPFRQVTNTPPIRRTMESLDGMRRP